jgi:hypothetical protein
MIYASTTDLGEIDLTPISGIYQIKDSSENIGKNTRGEILKAKGLDEEGKAAEFSGAEIVLKTGR